MAWYASCRCCGGMGKKCIKTHKGDIMVECRACGGSGSNKSLWSDRCQRCYSEIIYPVGISNPPTYCRTCKQIMREERNAKWKEKNCPECGATIKYNTDWTNIPNLCNSCKEKKRREREEQKAKLKKKSGFRRATRCSWLRA